jgi:TPR repeat protein
MKQYFMAAAIGALLLLPARAGAENPERNDPAPFEFNLMESLARQGCTWEQKTLGDAYRYGIYGADVADPGQALKWYRRAATQDDWHAQEVIGELYEHGEGVDQSDTEAYFWYSLAFRRGSGLALDGLWSSARHHVDGQLSPEQKAAVDKRVADWKPVREMRLMPNQRGAFIEEYRPSMAANFPLYRELAEQGDPYFQGQLASMYYRGEGTAPDKAEAAKWYRMAADQGEYDAIKWLGKMYAAGDGVPQDWQQAYLWGRIVASCAYGPDAETYHAAMHHLTNTQMRHMKAQVDAWFATPFREDPQPGAAKTATAR